MNKRAIFLFISIIQAVLILVASCATSGVSTGKTVPLDQAIRKAAKNIEDNVQAGQKIAVLNFSSPTEQFSAYVIEELSIQLVNGKKLVVVDRRELDLIRQEEQFQLSGEVSDESAQSIGKKLGAQLVVSGSLNSMGSTYRFRIRTLNVESAVVEAASSADLNAGETKVTFMLSDARPVAVVAQPASAVRPIPATPTSAGRPTPANMVRINGGTFTMGSPANEPGRHDEEGPQHQVTVSSFYMGKYEVTQKEYIEVMRTNPSDLIADELPVSKVRWFDAVEYCNKRSQKEGLMPAYTINGTNVTWNRNATGYRLPTEAEWEYACRAGTTTAYNTGDNITTSQANYHKGVPIPVGSYAPNAWGLYDMHGNVWEWCWDWYGSYSSTAQTDPMGASSGSDRVVRGGGCLFLSEEVKILLRSAFRATDVPLIKVMGIGFRIVRPLAAL